mmetsp:Transcript_45348/g.102427  ORF Transcript_45348/g.102427 Transcript_45348/m.102427 type:complete len:924 (-) Transcript_45348:365-3136(-)
MRAWYLDDGECRCTLQILKELGVLYWFIPLENKETAEELLGQIKTSRNYASEDQIEVSQAKLGAGLEAKLDIFFREHSHDDEEVRLILDGEGYFDVRDSADLWVRIHVTKGDLIVLPQRIMHRFTVVPATKFIVARRLFQTNPKWEAVNRFAEPRDCGESAPAYGPDSLNGEEDPRTIIPAICKQFYDLGWVTGTGGGMAIRYGNRFFMAPSGVMKERLEPKMMYVLDSTGTMLETPKQHPKQKPLKLSECAPLFMHAFDIRGAGAVLHSHSRDVVMATLLDPEADEFVVSHQEMIKGIAGHRYDEQLVVPIIENTPRESNLADLLAAAIKAYPKSPAVMVRRHGVYVWGNDWRHAKTQAECLDYLCGWAIEMRRAGLDFSVNPFTAPGAAGKIEAWVMDSASLARGADQRLPMRRHPNEPFTKAQLETLGVLQWKLDADKYETDPVLAQIRKDRGYTYHDMITVSPERLPNYETKIKSFFSEHLHTDEEIRYILDGSGYFDVRAKDDKDWIRIHMKKGDLITLPAGIYHRFTLDSRNYIKAMRLFVGEPVWTAYDRSAQVDAMPARDEYLTLLANGGANGGAPLGSQALGQAAKRSASEAGIGIGIGIGNGNGAAPSIGDYATSGAIANGAGASLSASATASAKRSRSAVAPLKRKYGAVVLDIEGTTTPISFVKDVLFPYAAKNVECFLTTFWGTPLVEEDVSAVRAQSAADLEDPSLLAQMPGFVDCSKLVDAKAASEAGDKARAIEALVANVLWQIGHNRKTKALKALQGHIWKAGYEAGELKGQMYADVLPALKRWQQEGTKVFIYSSGSRQAQRLIFGYSEAGDLKPYLSGYFDTNIGAKMEMESYQQILETIGCEDATQVLFATDLYPEAKAAHGAGMHTVLMLRSGNGDLPRGCEFATAKSFDEVFAGATANLRQ